MKDLFSRFGMKRRKRIIRGMLINSDHSAKLVTMNQERKIALITIYLVPEASDRSHSQIEKEIADSLQCDWLKRIEKVTVLDAK